MEDIEKIKKNNELFANSLTYKIIGKQNFIKLLNKGGFDSWYIDKYASVVEKYLTSFESELEKHLNNLKK